MERGNWTDAYPISKYLTAKANHLGIPLHGAFELTSRCNFDCKMCYVHWNKNQKALKEKELTTDQWLELAEEAKRCGTLFLLLTGGEPFLRDDFLLLYEKIARMGFRVVLNTNASLLNQDILDCFRYYPPGRINVSLYGGCNETYEKLCGVAAKDKVLDSIRKLKGLGISVRINMTITPYNVQDVEQVYEISQQEKTLIMMTSYLFPPIRLDSANCGRNVGRFCAADAGSQMINWRKMRLPEEIFSEWVKEQLQVPKDMPDTEGGKVGDPIRCQAGRSSYWITWDGMMRPCGMMASPERNVIQTGFESAWNQIRELASQIRLPYECKHCEKREICHVCAAMCQSETGAFDQRPDYVCEMAEEMKKQMLDLHRK